MKRRSIIDRIKFRYLLKNFKLNPIVYKYNKPLLLLKKRRAYKLIFFYRQ